MQQNSSAQLKGKTTVYTSCLCNCGSNSQCVFKAHIKDGIVVAVEPDDRYNTGVGREDEVISESDLIKVRLQRRPCTKGLVFHKYIYHPNRILYPLKRDPNSKRGEGKYIRISWDEALTTIANKMQEIREKYGPYSIMTPYLPNPLVSRLFSFWGAGVDSWGMCSFDAHRLAAHLVGGEMGWDYPGFSSGSASDMLANSKLIILWGLDRSIIGHIFMCKGSLHLRRRLRRICRAFRPCRVRKQHKPKSALCVVYGRFSGRGLPFTAGLSLHQCRCP